LFHILLVKNPPGFKQKKVQQIQDDILTVFIRIPEFVENEPGNAVQFFTLLRNDGYQALKIRIVEQAVFL
jgi:hypothetical protein